MLLPVDDDEEDESEVVILRIEAVDDETDSYASVEDEDTLMAVYHIFKNKFKDMFDFED